MIVRRQPAADLTMTKKNPWIPQGISIFDPDSMLPIVGQKELYRYLLTFKQEILAPSKVLTGFFGLAIGHPFFASTGKSNSTPTSAAVARAPAIPATITSSSLGGNASGWLRTIAATSASAPGSPCAARVARSFAVSAALLNASRFRA